MTYKRYEKYKDSGVEWIGEIPEEWILSKIKYNAKINELVLSENTDEEYTFKYIDIGSVNSCGDLGVLEEYKFKNAPSRARRILRNGDTIVSTVRTYLRAVTSFENITPDYVCSTGFAVLTPNRSVNYKYLAYLMKSNEYIEQIVSRSTGVSYPAINSSEIGNLQCILPSIKIQESIANFLDKKTSEIDALISDKEKLIELLKEKRQAIITEAVTKGLNPNVKMKDSGVKWIGEIPEHWMVTSVKRVISKGKEGMKIGPFGSDLKLEEMNESFPFKVYGQENLINDNFNLGSRFITEEKFKGMSAYELFPGDITISMMGTIGKCKVIPQGIVRGIMDSHLIRIRTNKKIIVPEFLQILIDSSYYVYNQLINQSKGSIMNGLNSTIIKNIIIALPNICEQVEILNYVKRKNEEINIIVDNIENQTVKLKQYKQSLISEAVTGKIDVRDLSGE